jgi:hypothetical protein
MASEPNKVSFALQRVTAGRSRKSIIGRTPTPHITRPKGAAIHCAIDDFLCPWDRGIPIPTMVRRHDRRISNLPEAFGGSNLTGESGWCPTSEAPSAIKSLVGAQ